MGMRLFERGSACKDKSCGGCGKRGCRGGKIAARVHGAGGAGGRVRGAIASHAGHRGCGRFGCGRDGKLCLSCRARGGKLKGLLPASIGEIPRTEEPQGMYGAGGPGQAPQYMYPYYTTRGPRDFLRDNPPTIGY